MTSHQVAHSRDNLLNLDPRPVQCRKRRFPSGHDRKHPGAPSTSGATVETRLRPIPPMQFLQPDAERSLS